ncbi:hypothetical protein CH373_17975 [Leptospira perolatii]|uniref:HTH marR-type domain-containing protein n=1 Tax=Leptospira perolatii TaxID=2023191 RepID=A0A2M9ZI33_9LEPT|nr:MarR family transcriptional regulator [Leptospira perolatii]PJZ68099.1 hypothetical protein CH360_17915 [Leptospira perolatii]PJZ71718.1 hypothetical protein CH373_17975 [Leptospira perolatii]
MKKISSEKQKLIQELLQAGRENGAAIVMFHTAIGNQMGLNATDSKTMDILDRKGPLTAGEIAEETGLATASVTGLIDRLEKLGFVERVRDAKDRRKVFVKPIFDEYEKQGQIFSSLVNSLTGLYSNYKDSELATILDFIRKLTVTFREETNKLQPKD